MSERVRLVTVAGDPDAEARFVNALALRPDVELVFRCVDRVELLAAIRGSSPDLLVCVGAPVWLDRQSCDEAVAARIPFVGMAAGREDADALAGLGIVVLPLDADLDRVLAASAGALPQAPAAVARTLEPRGRLVSVWGPKGAPGRSTVALELATELSATSPTPSWWTRTPTVATWLRWPASSRSFRRSCGRPRRRLAATPIGTG